MRRIVTFAILPVLALALGGVTYLTAFNKPAADTRQQAPTASRPNNRPATKEEKAESEQRKNEAVNQPAPPAPGAPASSKNVTPTISYWGQNPQSNEIEVSSYVQGIYEAGGTCTLTMRQGSAVATQTGSSQKDATTTTCGTLRIPRAQLASGSWEAVVSYQSVTAAGASKPQRIEVQ